MHQTENLQVLYEDNHLIAVLKPAGLLVQSDHSGDFCLLETVRQYLREKYLKPGDAFVGLLHRLDRPVSGVILFAKTSKGASRLSDQIRSRTIRKTYLALVEGCPAPAAGTLRHFHSDGETVSAPVILRQDAAPGFRPVELGYRVLRSGKRHSLVEVDLRTGKKHQIRAQLAAAGCPIAGDVRYGARLEFDEKGIGLLAYSLEFDHPTREERILVTHPEDSTQVWSAWL